MFKDFIAADHLVSSCSAVNLFSMNKTIERYQKRAKDAGISSKMGKDNMEPVKEDTFTLAKKIEHLEISKRKLLGDGLEPCSIDELNQLENQLERSLTRIRARKVMASQARKGKRGPPKIFQ
ncbi:hypothetical protein OIU76_017898, partial [Salix suchowensis]